MCRNLRKTLCFEINIPFFLNTLSLIFFRFFLIFWKILRLVSKNLLIKKRVNSNLNADRNYFFFQTKL